MGGFTAEETSWLREHVPGTPWRQVADEFNRRFGKRVKPESLGSECRHIGIKNGLSAQRGEQCVKSGRWLPVGTELRGKDGYIVVKTNDAAGPKRTRWKLKHHLVWEREHGPIPGGCAVIFADGDPGNFDPENLLCVTRAELARINRQRLAGIDPDLTRAGLALVRLQNKIGERMREDAP